jgi:hypothetical protein
LDLPSWLTFTIVKVDSKKNIIILCLCIIKMNRKLVFKYLVVLENELKEKLISGT